MINFRNEDSLIIPRSYVRVLILKKEISVLIKC